jgi:hypothetical protein
MTQPVETPCPLISHIGAIINGCEPQEVMPNG